MAYGHRPHVVARLPTMVVSHLIRRRTIRHLAGGILTAVVTIHSTDDAPRRWPQDRCGNPAAYFSKTGVSVTAGHRFRISLKRQTYRRPQGRSGNDTEETCNGIIIKPIRSLVRAGSIRCTSVRHSWRAGALYSGATNTLLVQLLQPMSTCAACFGKYPGSGSVCLMRLGDLPIPQACS